VNFLAVPVLVVALVVLHISLLRIQDRVRMFGRSLPRVWHRGYSQSSCSGIVRTNTGHQVCDQGRQSNPVVHRLACIFPIYRLRSEVHFFGAVARLQSERRLVDRTIQVAFCVEPSRCDLGKIETPGLGVARLMDGRRSTLRSVFIGCRSVLALANLSRSYLARWPAPASWYRRTLFRGAVGPLGPCVAVP
jgi:hypothetical protein